MKIEKILKLSIFFHMETEQNKLLDALLKTVDTSQLIEALIKNASVENCNKIKSDLQRGSTLAEFKSKNINKRLYHAEQEETALKISNNIGNLKVLLQITIGQTQSGKTGCMLALTEKVIQQRKIPATNIFIISGVNDNEWRNQTQTRFSGILKSKNIAHRQNFRDLKKRLEDLQDVLIIIDEAHVASREHMTMDNMISQLGLKDVNSLYERNINFVLFSATPNATHRDCKFWGKHSVAVHFLKSGVGYTGCETLKAEGRLRQAISLNREDPKPGDSERTKKIKGVT